MLRTESNVLFHPIQLKLFLLQGAMYPVEGTTATAPLDRCLL